MSKPLIMLPQWSGFLDLTSGYRYKVAHSGRGAGKSVGAIVALLKLASTVKIRILCLRYVQGSIAESVKAEIESAIYASGIDGEFKITEKQIINLKTGSVFHFKGLFNNLGSIKSLAQYDIAYIEEADDITQEAWDKLDPTIRKKDSEIWCVFNPSRRTTCMAQTFLGDKIPPKTLLMTATYLDNPLLDESQVIQAEHMKEKDPAKYRHVWLGQFEEDNLTRLMPNIVVRTLPKDQKYSIVMGVDVAEEGGDRTVFVIRQGYSIIGRHVYDTMPKDKLAETVKRHLWQWKPDRTNIDTTGFGSFVLPLLRASGIDNPIYEVNFSESARQSDKYHNRRTELGGLGADFFANGGAIPEEFRSIALELEVYTYVLDTKRRLQLISKKDMKKLLGGKSPDEADAFLLSLDDPLGMFRVRSVLTGFQESASLMSRELIQASKWGGR